MSALLLAVALTACVPARWDSADVKTLDLVKDTPINCLLIDEPRWSRDFITAAKAKGLSLLGVVASDDAAKRASALGFDALVVEGTNDVKAEGATVVRLPIRTRMDLAKPGPVAGTTQGLWPGVHVEKDGAVVAAPTGAPWIDTNAGFLRYVRSSVGAGVPVWIANRPPEGEALNGRRYVQAIADAAMSGAQWVLALDKRFFASLTEGDPKALGEWKQINTALRFYNDQRQYWQWPDRSMLALLQDGGSGALYSGGFMDMMGARHIPATIVPATRFMTNTPDGVKLLLNIDPSALSDAEKEKVKDVARGGAMIVNGPPGWKLSMAEGGAITFSKDQVKQLDEAWKEINSLVGRRNFGVRIFGAPSMLSNLKASPDGKRLAIHLVNYSDYPVEQISLHLEGKWTKATLLTPEGPHKGDLYPMEEGAGVDIDKVADVAIVVVE